MKGLDMKKFAYTLAATAAIAVATPAIAASPLTNPGFETGDTSGWVTNPSDLVSVVSNFNGYNPYQGDYFAVLSSGAGANLSTVASQLFNMTAGQTFYVATAFLGGDYLPYNDSGAVGVLNFVTSTNTVLFSKDIATVGNYGSTPWKVVSFTAPNTGSYYLSANVKNVGDNSLNSYLLLDSASGVPEASTWAMMILGLGAVGGILRRRRQKVGVNYSFA